MAYQLKGTLPRFLAVMIMLVTALFAVPHAAASQAITLNGSFAYFFPRQAVLAGSTGLCPSGIADVCGVIQMDGLGAADWTWVDSHTWAYSAEKLCFDGSATFTLTLRSDGSTISGPTTAIFCRRIPDIGVLSENALAWGNPFIEDDTIQLANGTGQFAGLHGTAILHVSSNGAAYKGTLTGTLGN